MNQSYVVVVQVVVIVVIGDFFHVRFERLERRCDYCVMLPPAFSIAARAGAETGMPVNESFLLDSPPTIFNGVRERAETNPFSTSIAREICVPFSKSAWGLVSESAIGDGRGTWVRPRFLP